MKKALLLFILLFALRVAGFTQDDDLPVKEWTASSSSTPFVLYISGDGGFNSFSTDLCEDINKAGYSITAINARSYFWDKKTPEQVASAIAAYLKKHVKTPDQQVVLAGYSFGADVMPFIVGKLPDSIKKKLVSVILLAPSTSTDFEVHWSDIFGGDKKRSMDVVAAINTMTTIKTITIFGSDENDFPVSNIKLQNYVNRVLPGGHHFGSNINEVAGTMINYFK